MAACNISIDLSSKFSSLVLPIMQDLKKIGAKTLSEAEFTKIYTTKITDIIKDLVNTENLDLTTSKTDIVKAIQKIFKFPLPVIKMNFSEDNIRKLIDNISLNKTSTQIAEEDAELQFPTLDD